MYTKSTLSKNLLTNFAKKCDLFIDLHARSADFSELVAVANPRTGIIVVPDSVKYHGMLEKKLEAMRHNARDLKRGKKVSEKTSAPDGGNGGGEKFLNYRIFERIDVAEIEKIIEKHREKSVLMRITARDVRSENLIFIERLSAFCKDLSVFMSEISSDKNISGKEFLAMIGLGFDVYAVDDITGCHFRVKDESDLSRIRSRNTCFSLLSVRKETSLSVVFFSHTSELRGAERSLVDLVEDLCAERVLCSVILPSEGPLKQKLFEKGASVHVLALEYHGWVCEGDHPAKEKIKKQFVGNVRDKILPVLRVLRSLSPDVIFTQTLVSPLGALCAEILSIPHVVSIREYGELDHEYHFFFGFRESIKALYRSSGALFCITKSVRDEVFKGIKYEKEKVGVVYGGVRINNMTRVGVPGRSLSAEKDHRFKIGIFGTISRGKGQEDLVRAATALMEKGLDLDIYLIGNSDPSYLFYLEEILKDGPFREKFFIMDFVDDPVGYMKKMDIVVSCSRNEAMGRTLVESVLAGVPIIFPDSGGPREIFNPGEHGLAYIPGDPADLAEKILYLIDHPLFSEKMTNAARKYLKTNFKKDVYSGAIERRLRELKKKPRDPSFFVTRLFFERSGFLNEGEVFHPALYYSDTETGFNEQQKISHYPIFSGPFTLEFKIPDGGYSYLRLDPDEGKFLELAVSSIYFEGGSECGTEMPGASIVTNGTDIGDGRWLFYDPDPILLIRAPFTASKVMISGSIELMGTEHLGKEILRLKKVDALEEKMAEKNQEVLGLRISKKTAEEELEDLRAYCRSLTIEMDSVYSSRLWKLLTALSGPLNVTVKNISGYRKGVTVALNRIRAVLLRGLFDGPGYLENNPDVRRSGMDPYKHYCAYGVFEGRKPAFKSYISLKGDLQNIDGRYFCHSGSDPWGWVKFLSGKDKEKKRSEKEETRTEGSDCVLFVGHDAEAAGAQILLLRILKWLKANTEIRFKLILLKRGPLLKEYKDLSPVIVWEQVMSKYTEPGKREKFLKDFGRGTVLIYGNTVISAGIYGKLELLNAPYVTHVHELEKSINMYAGKEVARKMTEYTDMFIACSEPVGENLITKHAVDPGRVKIINGFIEGTGESAGKKYKKYEAKKRNKGTTLIVLGCGSVYWRKGADLFIETAIELKNRGVEDFRFYWVGENWWDRDYCSRKMSSWKDLEQKFTRAGLGGHVRFLGPKKDISEYYAKADIFYLPSREDPFPLVCLEAAQFALPVICFAGAGGITGFVEDDAGYSVPYEDYRSAAEKILFLKNNPDVRRELGEKARKKVAQRHLASGTCPRILDACKEVIAPRERTSSDFKDTGVSVPAIGSGEGISIIIPTYNGGGLFKKVLDSIFGQDFPGRKELIIVDSGSEDGTDKLAESYGAIVKRISNQEFHHSRTRRSALSLANYERIIYTVQDALPLDHKWLGMMFACLDESIAGAYIRQIPHQDADLYARFEVDNHSEYLGEKPRIQARVHAERKGTYQDELFKCRFDNVAAIYWRKELEEIPFPDVDFAEDMAWAREVTNRGKKILYAPHIQIYHSHNRTPEYRFKRAVVDNIFTPRVLGMEERDLSRAGFDEIKTLEGLFGELEKICIRDLTTRKKSINGSVTMCFEKNKLRREKRRLKGFIYDTFCMIEGHIFFTLWKIKRKYPEATVEDMVRCVPHVISVYHGMVVGQIYSSHFSRGSVPEEIENMVLPMMKGI